MLVCCEFAWENDLYFVGFKDSVWKSVSGFYLFDNALSSWWWCRLAHQQWSKMSTAFCLSCLSPSLFPTTRIWWPGPVYGVFIWALPIISWVIAKEPQILGDLMPHEKHSNIFMLAADIRISCLLLRFQEFWLLKL